MLALILLIIFIVIVVLLFLNKISTRHALIGVILLFILAALLVPRFGF